MPDRTHTPTTDDTPAAYGWCSWHRDHARGVRLISVVEQGSGPGGGAFACQSCITEHGLIPFADRP